MRIAVNAQLEHLKIISESNVRSALTSVLIVRHLPKIVLFVVKIENLHLHVNVLKDFLMIKLILTVRHVLPIAKLVLVHQILSV